MDGESLRLTDILTTASAVANYLGAGEVTAAHVAAAVDVLVGRATMEDIGRPLSPLVRRPAGGGAEPRVRALAQRWFAALGNDAMGELDAEKLAAFETELAALTRDD